MAGLTKTKTKLNPSLVGVEVWAEQFLNSMGSDMWSFCKTNIVKDKKKAGAELGKAPPKLGLGKIKINLALVKSRKVV